jgi:fatty-acyl-CoA synthase
MAITGDRSIWMADSFGADLLDLTIGDLLDKQAARRPDREALVFVDPDFGIDVRWRYAELQSRVDRLARGLMALGIAPADRVAVLAPNLPEWILLEYALAKIGAVLITVNTAYREHELDYLLRQSRARALFTVATYRGNRYLETLRAIERAAPLRDLHHTIVIGDNPAPGIPTFADILGGADSVPPDHLIARQAAVKPTDIVQIQYTSGTTGAPKGVMLTHHGTVNNARLMGLRAGWTEHDRLLAVMPLFHTAGCVCNVLGMLACGGTLLGLVAFDSATALGMIRAEGATIMNGVPTMYIRLLAEPGVRSGTFADSSLRIAFLGGTAIPPVVLQDMKEAFGADPMVIMGMTEASPLITQTLPTDNFERSSTTAGIPLPFTAIKVIDPTTGEPVAIGEEGELCISGYGVTPGYFDMPERTAEAIDPAGWLHSGDLATLDAQGYLRIVGRAKDMIIRGGENLYPAEIENLLMRHKMIEQVQVVGVPDPEFGEEAYAFIILRDGADLTIAALRDHCRASFSRHKVPRYMEFIAAFPQTASGKIKKFELREEARRRLASP